MSIRPSFRYVVAIVLFVALLGIFISPGIRHSGDDTAPGIAQALIALASIVAGILPISLWSLVLLRARTALLTRHRHLDLNLPLLC
jgi:cbb3-type cytochrome oxidase subunit 1